jgi:hypothetical protein
MVGMAKDPVPVLVTVIVPELVLEPTFTLPKAAEAGATLNVYVKDTPDPATGTLAEAVPLTTVTFPE